MSKQICSNNKKMNKLSIRVEKDCSLTIYIDNDFHVYDASGNKSFSLGTLNNPDLPSKITFIDERALV